MGKLCHKVRMLHWQDIIDASKHHWVTDFHRDTPHTPLIGAKMQFCDAIVF